MAGRTYYVYILSSQARRLYVGVTNDSPRRVYYETIGDINDAIAREEDLFHY